MPEDQEDPRADLIWGTVPRLVDDGARRHGATEALVDGEVRLTYAQLAPEVDRYARGFVAAGVGARGPGGHLGAQLRRVDAGRAGPLAGRGRAGPDEHALQGRRGGLHRARRRAPRPWSRCAASSASTTPRCWRARTRARWRGSSCCATTSGVAAGPGRGGTVPVVGLGDFLAAGDAVDPSVTAARAAAVRARRHLRPHLHLGHHRSPQGGGDDPRPVAAHVRDLVVHRRSGRRRPLPRRQPVLPHLRLQGGHPGLPHGRRHHGARGGLRRERP